MNARFLLLLGCTLLTIAAFLWGVNDAAGQDGPLPGTWVGIAEFEADSGLAATDLTFTVDETGQITDGVIILKFTYPTMSAELLNLMLEYGCIVSFDIITAESQPVAGMFSSAQTAAGTFAAARCSLQEYGDLEFLDAITGTWSAAPVAALAESTADAPPTRMPTLDPNQPTPKPTRVPTLDPNQLTAVPNQTQHEPGASSQDMSDASIIADVATNPTGTTDTANPAAPAAAGSDDVIHSASYVTTEEYPYDPPGEHVTDGMNGRKMYKEYCEECHGQQEIGTQDAPELEALNALRIADTVRDGPEDMDVFTHEDIPDRTLNILIDYVLLFHPDSEPRPAIVITLPTKE